jgi:MFS family permease
MREVGYFELVRCNRAFRRFWFANIISMLGEWVNLIALFVLINTHTGSAFLIGVLLTVRMGAFAIFQPFIGMLADRWSRKWMMIFANGASVIIALSFLRVDGPEDMVWMIALTGLMTFFHGIYMTAEMAALPNIVADNELVTANTLGSASWSTSLALGSALGGFVVSVAGTDAAFIIDAATFAIGLIVLLFIDMPQKTSAEMEGPLLRTGFANIVSGWKRIFAEKRLLRILFAKAAWNIAGGGLAGVFLVLAASEYSVNDFAMGIGLFYLARGIGTGIGPLLARRWFKDRNRWPQLLGHFVTVSGLVYLVISLTIHVSIWLTFALIIIAHSGSAASWVFSTILEQEWVEDEMRGRVFSADMLLLSAALAISTSLAGWLVEYRGVGLSQGMVLFSIVMIIVGIAFTLWRPKSPTPIQA